ncbi:MAG: DUF5682 family protein, partial [Myxococcota bacterium]
MSVETRYFGVRHHGPGSARSLRAAFESWRPSLVLIEGPPDANGLLEWVGEASLRPPVALMVYDPARPRRAAFYPFAVFSPEWVAMLWARQHGAEVRFMDLPLHHQIALDEKGWGVEGEDLEELTPEAADPLTALARAAGERDGERWWGRLVEERRGVDSAFEAILEAMTALRAEAGPAGATPRQRRREELREAFMRKTIRAAERGDTERVAVVAGAWHVPMLRDRPSAAEDQRTLRGLPRRKTASTWVPWTHGRLSIASGYGAGVLSPGWYHHLFVSRDDVAEGWLTQVARLLREEGFEAPPSSIIDAVRLAEALAALRSRSAPGLKELEEATLAALLHGRREKLDVIARQLVVGEVLGEVPASVPEVPLAADLRQLQKRVRLPPKPEPKEIVLDLREEAARAKSQLLHRLTLLNIPWGKGGHRVEGRGSFKESWILAWDPDLAVRVVEAARWGTTVEAASRDRARARLREQDDLPALLEGTERLLWAGYPDLLGLALRRLDAAAAGVEDVTRVADAVPALARLARYGDARETDREGFQRLLDGLVARFRAGLLPASLGLGAEKDEALADRIDAVDRALRLLDDGARRRPWLETLSALVAREEAAPMCRGRGARRLLEAGAATRRETSGRLARALARGAEPSTAARWLEGFLGGSALLLLHDEALLGLLDGWLADLSDEAFLDVLPLLRRTFSTLPAAERKRIGSRLAGR